MKLSQHQHRSTRSKLIRTSASEFINPRARQKCIKSRSQSISSGETSLTTPSQPLSAAAVPRGDKSRDRHLAAGRRRSPDARESAAGNAAPAARKSARGAAGRLSQLRPKEFPGAARGRSETRVARTCPRRDGRFRLTNRPPAARLFNAAARGG